MSDSMSVIFHSLAEFWEDLHYSDPAIFYTLFDLGLAVLLNSIFFALCLIPFVVIFRIFDWGVRL